MELSELILGKIKRDHQGKENVITRRELLDYCHWHVGAVTDRQLRNIYCQLPVATCDKGIFWPVTTKEKHEFRLYLRKKALPLFTRWMMFAKTHCDDAGKQMELF